MILTGIKSLQLDRAVPRLQKKKKKVKTTFWETLKRPYFNKQSCSDNSCRVQSIITRTT